MKQVAYITQGHSEYEPRLRSLLDASGIDPEEFVGLDYFSLSPFFVLAGATVAPDAHAHGADIHVTGVRVSVPEELEDAFLLDARGYGSIDAVGEAASRATIAAAAAPFRRDDGSYRFENVFRYVIG